MVSSLCFYFWFEAHNIISPAISFLTKQTLTGQIQDHWCCTEVCNIGQYKEPQYTNGKFMYFFLHRCVLQLISSNYKISKLFLHHLIDTKYYQRKKIIINLKKICFHFAIHYNSQNNESDYFSSKTLSKIPWKMELCEHCMKVSYKWKPWPTLSVYNK